MSRSRFPLQILTFVVLPLLALVLIVAIGGAALHQAAMRDMILDHNLHAVRGAAGSLSHALDVRYAVLNDLSERGNENPDLSPGGADAWLNDLFDGGVAIYDSHGDLLWASSALPLWQRSELQHPRDPGLRYLPLPAGSAQPARIAVAGTPGADGRRAVGVTSLSALGLADLFESLHPDEATTIQLVDSGGQILYHSNPAHIGQPLSDPLLTGLLHGADSGAVYLTERTPGDVVATYAPVSAAGWLLIQQERWRDSLGLLTRYSQAAPLALVPGLLLAAGAVWFGIRRIVQPLQQLERRATDLAWGDFASIEQPVGGIEEIRQLQATLRHLASRVQSAQAGMHNYIGAITQTQEDERARLARELHDQTVQTLIALGHREQRLKRYLADSPEAAALLDELRQMTTQAVDDLRRTVRAMRPVYLEELGLTPALEMLAHDQRLDNQSIEVAFEKTGQPRRLPAEHEMALYRIAQEALTNAWRHSGARNAWLSVSFGEDGVTVSVRDDGKGFTAPRRVTDLSEEGHFGLMGMVERAALIGAHLQVESEPGRGATVTVRAPLPVSGQTVGEQNAI